MGDFRSGNRGGFGGGRDRGRGSFGGGRGGGRSFGGGRGGFGGGRDRGRGEMYDATCSKCGKACQLPFKPRGDKPVYCSACFETEGQTSPRQAPSGSSGISSEQFNKLNAKLDKIIAILEELEIISDDDEDLDEISADAEDIDDEEDIVEEPKKGQESDDDFDDDEDFDDEEESISK